jgi:hypothetical protein
MNPKYKLVDLSEEKKNSFMNKFMELCKSENVYFEPVPQFTRDTIGAPWEIVTQILLQRKVPIEDESPVVEDGVPSPFTTDEPNKEN